MAEYMIVPTDSIDATADAIKAKLGSQNDLVWGQDGFAEYVEDIPSGGMDYLAELCNNTLTVYHSTAVTQLYSGYPFRSVQSLVGVVLPNLTTIRYYDQFNGSVNLEYTDLGGTFERLQNRQYSGCTKFAMLVIRKTSSIAILPNTNVFDGTCFADGGTGGTLYVPNSLLSTYQNASNWSTILAYTNNQIKSIESTHTDSDAPIDLTLYYADGTLIPT